MVSSIWPAVTSRWVQARMRPSIIASVTPRWRSAATILSPAMPAPSGLKNTRLVSGSCTSTPAICDSPRASERGLLPDRTTADIGGLLDADDRLRRLVAGARVERLAKRFRRELAIGALQLGDLEAADRGMRAALPRDDMRALVREDLIARTAM